MAQNESAKSNISTSADSSDNVRGREESLRSVLNEEEELEGHESIWQLYQTLTPVLFTTVPVPC